MAPLTRSVFSSRRARFCNSSGVSSDPIIVSETFLASLSWLRGIKPGVNGSLR